MKKYFFGLFVALFLLPLIMPVSVSAAKTSTAKAPVITANDLVGRLVLQYENDFKLWYIEPISKERYYLHNDDDLQLLTGEFGVWPTVSDFKKLAKNSRSKTPSTLVAKYAGKIIIDPSSTDDKRIIYYLNPADNIAYIINSFGDFYKAGKVIGIGASDSLLREFRMNRKQFTYDPVFYGTAQVRYSNGKYFFGNESGRILSLASLTKVMTALVFYETNPDWSKVVEITPEEIRSPCTLQTCGLTSEIDLKVGDKIKISDLWIAMLTASSNQSAKILADNSGLTQEEFIKKMNQKASSLGLIKTRFVEMSGLSADNVSTAEEFAKITQLAFSNEIIAAGTRYTDYIFYVTQSDGSVREVKVQNRNYSLLALNPIASKSGYLVEAQRNAVVMKDNKVAVVLHAYSLNQRNDIVKRIIEGQELADVQ